MEDSKKVSRRKFLRLSAVSAASAALVACGADTGQTGGTTGATTGGATTGGAEATAAAPGGTTGGATTGGTEATATATEGGTTGGGGGTTGGATAGETATAGAAGGGGGGTTGGATAGETATAGAAGGGGTTQQPPAPGSYKQAPMLDEMADLPPVAERLPKNPYVVPHAWVQPGKYGGTMQLVNSWGGNGTSNMFLEFMYGHSHLRWLKDGLEIGPGTVESWETNADATDWTFKFREGLKWSDGQPFTVNDIMYWWEDLVINEEHPEAPPDEARSGTGTLATLKMVDDTTLQMTFDAPAPLTADRLAMWVKGPIGPRWVTPRHYLEQFHPKYNTAVKDFTEHDLMMDTRTNPACPVLTGWKLTNYEEGTRSTFERNPYYWVVDSEGNQLPYIDRANIQGFQDQEVMKLNIQQGKADFTFAGQVALTDVAELKQQEQAGGFALRFWESGSGSGVAFFFSYDFSDEAMRTVIRDPQFRKALSHAFNRAEVQKNFYFNTGEPTTGTFSPKAIEYNFNDEAKQRYAEWRDSAVAYDPERAKQMLEEAGYKAGAGGMRTKPDGSPLTVEVVYSATTSNEIVAQNELMVRDWKAVGIDARLVPLPPEGRSDKWAAGELMSNADWGIGDGPNHLVYPQWLVPLEPTRWSPLHGNFYLLRGTEKVSAEGKEIAQPDVDPYERNPPRVEAEPGGPIAQLWTIYDQSRVEPDAMKRHQLVWDMMRIHVEHGPFVQGSVANFRRPILVNNDLKNVPTIEDLALGGFTDPWIHPTPAVYDPESWYWENPEQHA